MRHLIVVLLLAFCLVGCIEKYKKIAFSITQNNSINSYDNNPNFIKIKADPAVLKGYKFTNTPEKVNGVKIDDLNFVGGYIYEMDSKDVLAPVFILTFKGRKDFDLLVDRVKETIKPFGGICIEKSIEIGNGVICMVGPQYPGRITIEYNPFIESTTLVMIRNKP